MGQTLVDQTQQKQAQVIIVGAGISGLITAYFFVKKNYSVQIYEKRDVSGGLIRTEKRQYGIVETAANAFINTDLLADICKDIDMEMFSTLKSARKRYILRSDSKQLKRFPFVRFEILNFLILILKLLFNKTALKPKSFESIKSWGTRIFGGGPSAIRSSLYSIETALQGIYAGDPEQMSAGLILNRFFNKNRREQNSKVKKESVSPKDGMRAFIVKLEAYLKNNSVEFVFNKEFTSDDVQYLDPKQILVLNTPAYESSLILKNLKQSNLSSLLSQVEYLPVVTCSIFFEEDTRDIKAFGVLFSPDQKFVELGVLFNHHIFLNRTQNARSETWILGGARTFVNPNLHQMSDQNILDDIQKCRDLLGFKREKILDYKLTRWPMALPHYTLKHESLLPEIEKEVEKWNASNRASKESFQLALLSNYNGSIGLSEMIARSYKLVENFTSQNGVL